MSAFVSVFLVVVVCFCVRVCACMCLSTCARVRARVCKFVCVYVRMCLFLLVALAIKTYTAVTQIPLVVSFKMWASPVLLLFLASLGSATEYTIGVILPGQLRYWQSGYYWETHVAVDLAYRSLATGLPHIMEQTYNNQ